MAYEVGIFGGGGHHAVAQFKHEDGADGTFLEVVIAGIVATRLLLQYVCSLVISENSTLCMIRINSATADMSDGAVALLLNDEAEALAAAASPPIGRVAIREELTS